jgi:hypothetical protein
MPNQGGTHEQPGKSGMPNTKNAGMKSGSDSKKDASGGSRSGSQEQHGKPGHSSPKTMK